jgi:hypothetical protein
MIAGLLLGIWIGITIGSMTMFFYLLGVVASGQERSILKVGAFLCSICPLCIFSRSKPDSELSQMMMPLKKACPFCAAFNRLRKQDLEKKEAHDAHPPETTV